ncbi:MAG: DUF1579 family protein [Acidobacteriota bacterium]
MKRIAVRLVYLSFAVAWLSAGLAAQMAAKPGPEHAKLGFFVGKWTSEGEMKPSPFGPGGKMTMTETCEWFEGNFAVVCHSEGKSPMGAAKGIAIMSYSNEEKAYTYYGADSMGMSMATVPRGTVQGDTWTYTDESMMGGQKVKSRYTIKVQSPTAYTFTMETQGPDGKWTTMMEGKATKAT